MKNKYLFILFVCLLPPLTLKGQTSLDFHLDSRKNSLETNPINYLIDQNHLHASPHKIQTVNLDKVDMYTGIPNITIPLYNISVGDINIPISLSYNATGVNPNQLSSFVGLNWSLNTGGDITKQVKGVEDFGFTFSDPYLKHGTLVDYSNLKDVSFERGRGILSVGWLTDKDFSFYDYYNITPKGQKKVDLNRTFVEKRDPFPDFFIVNSPGLTTKFVHKKDGTPMEIEYKGFDIKSYIGKSPLINFKKELFNDKFEELARKYSGPGTNKINCINRIDIKNNDGIDYVYDVLDVNQYAERSGFLEIGPNTPAYLTSQGVIKYHPSKIQDKYGNVVKFEYETYSVEEPIHRKQFIYKCLSFQGYRDTPLQINSTQTTFPLLHKIKKIIFRGGSIEFFYNFERKDVPSDKALKVIIVKSTNNKIIRKIFFNYDYFKSNTYKDNPQKHSTTLRLKLKSISIDDLPPYEFHYNQNPLPEVGTRLTDYLGFSNGLRDDYTTDQHPKYFEIPPKLYYSPNKKSYSVSPFKLFPESYEIVKHGRELSPSLRHSLSGILEEIKTPTGAIKKYHYELNDFSINNKTFQASGLRIKKHEIIDRDGKIAVSEEYEYKNENGESSGNINNFPSFGLARLDGYIDGYSIHNLLLKNYISFYITSGTNFPTTSFSGSHIGYSHTTVKKLNGFIEKEYFSALDAPSQIPFLSTSEDVKSEIIDTLAKFALSNGNIFPPYNDKEILWGNLKSEKIKDINGKVVSEKNYKYNYQFFQNIGTSIPIIGSQLRASRMGSAVRYFFFNNVFSHRFLKDSSSEKMFYSNDSFTQVDKNFYYDETYPLLKKMISKNKNNKIETNYKYGVDVKDSFLIKQHRLNEFVEKITLKNNIFLQQEERIYKPFKEKYYLNRINIRKNKAYISNFGTIDLYDHHGNILQYTKGRDIPISIIWGYNYLYPIAKLQGARYSEIPTDLIEELQELSDNGEEEKLNSKLKYLRTLFPDALITTYTHEPLVGIKSITSPNNSSEFYEYNDQNRLSKILDNEKNIKKEYYYNYAKDSSLSDEETEELFYNTTTSKQFLKKNCPSSQIGDIFTYSVPANKYISVISQNDADQRALYDIEKNGQMMANKKGTCFEMNYSVEGIDDPDFLSDGSVQKIDDPLLLSINLNFINMPSDNPCGQYVGRLKGKRITRQEIITGNRGEWLVIIEKTGEIFVKLRDINKDKPKRPVVYDKDGNKLDYFEEFTPWLYEHKKRISISFNYSIDIEKENSFSKFMNNFNQSKRCFHTSTPKEPIRIF